MTYIDIFMLIACLYFSLLTIAVTVLISISMHDYYKMNEHITTTQPAKRAGGWVLPGSNFPDGIIFMVNNKPNWLHRLMMKTLLGWGWKDNK